MYLVFFWDYWCLSLVFLSFICSARTLYKQLLYYKAVASKTLLMNFWLRLHFTITVLLRFFNNFQCQITIFFLIYKFNHDLLLRAHRILTFLLLLDFIGFLQLMSHCSWYPNSFLCQIWSNFDAEKMIWC